jgi:hypothetical protein
LTLDTAVTEKIVVGLTVDQRDVDIHVAQSVDSGETTEAANTPTRGRPGRCKGN